MKTLILTAREKNKLNIRQFAQLMQVDATLVSRWESGERIPSKKHLIEISKILKINYQQLLIEWHSQKILKEIKYEALAPEIINLVQERIEEYKILKPKNDLHSNRLKQLDQLKEKLQEIRQNDNEKIIAALDLEYTYESNRIEGNTLSLKETELVINKGITVAGKSMREHLEAINHQEAIGYVKTLALKNTILTERDIKAIHRLVLGGIDNENAGKYRKVPVMIQGSKHLPPQPYLIAPQMEDLFIWYEQNYLVLHPIILAAEMSERLVTIHPFIDGNGRTSRLLMNLILMQHGYPITSLKGDYENRMKYYNALETIQTTNNKAPFHQLIIENTYQSIERYLQILGCSI